ncbi:hypothetical protein LEP1GSC021_0097 [Leptospira noguchii str. 1993005606]|uniref:Uncharacterized protein n=1 Tax=Leptospira noguchii str. 2001034031 TaxID=1193053 RepID=M6YEN0_9LEPT|nr:hypothetical protein LEP1GSC024_4167 [Leptospira noguchii str. 2001034031]EPE85147.1 hypothetical protein LEP1GSC021_0097 [Leptospira noguchii str. 1993005606]
MISKTTIFIRKFENPRTLNFISSFLGFFVILKKSEFRLDSRFYRKVEQCRINSNSNLIE